jgi:hypothetical protein
MAQMRFFELTCKDKIKHKQAIVATIMIEGNRPIDRSQSVDC